MTQEEKDLLIRDLCARLPYGVMAKDKDYDPPFQIMAYEGEGTFLDNLEWDHNVDEIIPYLRPMSSMTDEERKEYDEYYFSAFKIPEWEVDFYNAHHFDYRGLIEKGLALEAPEGMYK